MSASLPMVAQETTIVDSLPIYRRDAETSSIRSSAPSYTSEAPSYHSQLPSSHTNASHRASIGLPPASYAPGYHRMRNLERGGISQYQFNINQWSPTYSSPQARHYHNVAARRTNSGLTGLGMIEEQNLMATLANQTIFPSLLAPTTVREDAATATSAPQSTTLLNAPSEPTASAQASTTLLQAQPQTEPPPPLEDPDLVGHAAASIARERRLYIARETHIRRQTQEREAQALREESRRWDFLLDQMADWEERDRGWKVFSKRFENGKASRGGNRRVLFRFWK